MSARMQEPLTVRMLMLMLMLMASCAITHSLKGPYERKSSKSNYRPL